MEKHDWIVPDTRLQHLFMPQAIAHLDIVYRSREKVLYFIILHLIIQWLICLLLLTFNIQAKLNSTGTTVKHHEERCNCCC